MSSDVIIKGSSIEGKGVFANRDFKKGEIVIEWNMDTILTKEEVDNLPENEKRYLFPLGDRFLLQQPPARYVNHSCDDYSYSSVPGETMECNCGSKNCKGIIGQHDKNRE